MADLLIRDIAQELLAAIDVKASALGVSRVEYVRRILRQELQNSGDSVTEEHIRGMLELTSDLADEEIMSQAWR